MWYTITAFGLLLLLGLYFARKHYQSTCAERAAKCADYEAGQMQKNPRVFTREELLQYNGKDPRHPLLLSLKGRVLDVRTGVDYYGPDGPYKMMAGRDASKAFAMMSLKEEDAHDDLTGVDEEHLTILDDWYDKLTQKYPTVGRIADFYQDKDKDKDT